MEWGKNSPSQNQEIREERKRIHFQDEEGKGDWGLEVGGKQRNLIHVQVEISLRQTDSQEGASFPLKDPGKKAFFFRGR